MGRAARMRPERLATKLRAVRDSLGLSQSEMWKRLGIEEKVSYKAISSYETGTTEPPLPVLLTYAKLAGICVDYLIDDSLDLPLRRPSIVKHRNRP